MQKEKVVRFYEEGKFRVEVVQDRKGGRRSHDGEEGLVCSGWASKFGGMSPERTSGGGGGHSSTIMMCYLLLVRKRQQRFVYCLYSAV